MTRVTDSSPTAAHADGTSVRSRDPHDWRRTAVFYQVYPRSFADGNGDGVGDLPGVTAHLEQLKALGVDAVWLSPFYTSPQADAGYDVADYRDVDPLFGTLADFDALVARAHELGLKVVVDLVPNHSSDEHPWFQQALAAGPGSPERERYLFRDGRGPDGDEPPNNWVSNFGGPAWTRTTNPDGTPGQWYLHLFDTKQPDWNWDNRQIHDEFLSILSFWLDRGVDGFRIDVANAMLKQSGLPDADESAGSTAFSALPDGEEPAVIDQPMYDRDEVHEVYREWRRLLDTYEPSRMLVAEAWVRPLSRLARYVRADEMDQAFNFEFLACPWDATVLRRVIDRSIAVNAEVGAPTTWVLSNHDVVRHVSRFGLPQDRPRPNGIRAQDPQPDASLGLRRGKAATALMLALPGSAYLYQGEELGLPEHTTLDDDLRQDPTWWRSGYTQAGRDGCRVPLPWVGGAPGNGFGPSDRTWLPQPDVYADLAWDRQFDVPGSTLEFYRLALRLRREHDLATGSLVWHDSDRAVLDFTSQGVRVVANVGATAVPTPAGEVLLSSGPLTTDGALPADTTVWLRV